MLTNEDSATDKYKDQIEDIKQLYGFIRKKYIGHTYFSGSSVPTELALAELVEQRFRSMPRVEFVTREIEKCFSVDSKTHKLKIDEDLLKETINNFILRC